MKKIYERKFYKGISACLRAVFEESGESRFHISHIFDSGTVETVRFYSQSRKIKLFDCAHQQEKTLDADQYYKNYPEVLTYLEWLVDEHKKTKEVEVEIAQPAENFIPLAQLTRDEIVSLSLKAEESAMGISRRFRPNG